jgi:hypothetical protein
MNEESWAALWLLATAAAVVACAFREAMDYLEEGFAGAGSSEVESAS